MQPLREVVDMYVTDISSVLQETEEVIRQCFTQYKTEEVFLSFNGGKDCTVLLDITLNVLRDLYKQDVAEHLKVVYIRTKGPFREIETFVKDVEKHYGVKLMVTDGELKAALQRVLDEDDRLKACLMGTRRTDPYSANLEFMQKTDPSWPQLVRVSPLLNWSYHDIWSYMLQRNVPYCSLYNDGYTSIGSTANTWPNPALTFKDAYGCLSYLPAWQLADGSLERAGRGNPPKDQPTEIYVQPTSNGHDFNTGQHLDTINGHAFNTGQPVDTINGHTFNTGQPVNTIKGHGFNTGQPVNTINGHAFNSGQHLDTINGHEFNTGRPVNTINGHDFHNGQSVGNDLL